MHSVVGFKAKTVKISPATSFLKSLLGYRVVRGPHWSWDDRDGGEGGVGTIVVVDKFSDGKAVPEKKVVVHWDADPGAYYYRVGFDGCYDLRVYSSASAGVKFNDVICDACLLSGITGTRWKCAECCDYDLCTDCYNNDEHDLNHTFIRYDSKDQSAVVGPRSSATKIEAKGIFPGSVVKNGDAPDANTGKVIKYSPLHDFPMGEVLVKWDGTEVLIPHKVGCQEESLEFELVLVESVSGRYYYKEHLSIASVKDSSATTMERFEVGDKVTIHMDLEVFQTMTVAFNGYWEPEMEKAIGEVGEVVEKHDNLGIGVKYKALELDLVFHPDLISKVHELRVKDRVKIVANKEAVKKLQVGHREWNDKMEDVLDKEGVVIEVDEKGDARVEVEGQTWWYNPAALILESKEQERAPPVKPTLKSKEQKDDKSTKRKGPFPDFLAEFMGKGVQAIEEALNDNDVKGALSEVAKNVEDIVSKSRSTFALVQIPQDAKTLTINVGNGEGYVSETQDDNTETIHEEVDTHAVQDPPTTEIVEAFNGEAYQLPTSPFGSMYEFERNLPFNQGVLPTILERIDPRYWPGNLDLVYKMTTSPRGLAVIINIKYFNTGMSSDHEVREGSDNDAKNMKILFENLDFETEDFPREIGADDLFHEIFRISKRDFTAYDCFVLCIMSHGTSDFINASDGGKIQCSTIRGLFERSESLAGKPKLFFIQACRGKKIDRGIVVSDDLDETPESGVATIPRRADILMAHACFEGHVSYRDTENGSIFIQSIVEVFSEHACDVDVLSMMTMVNKKVSEYEHSGEKQVPQPYTTLRKRLYFWPKLQFSS